MGVALLHRALERGAGQNGADCGDPWFGRMTTRYHPHVITTQNRRCPHRSSQLRHRRIALVRRFGADRGVIDPVRTFLLQMAGWMGTGKSTIAHAAATATGAIVIDHDTTKTALLEAGVPHPPAGAASFRVVHAIAADLLSQGHSVIIDSPSLYESIPEIGAAIAAQADAGYFFVECQCPDEIADTRIESRTNRTSQVRDRR